MNPEPDVRTRHQRDRAVHEAGHAVQAYTNGLGVHTLTLQPPMLATREQQSLIVAGHKLLDPPTLDDRLIEFYRLDIEVWFAGPLAALKHHLDLTGGNLSTINPAHVGLALWGGGSQQGSPGDVEVALHEAALLTRERLFKIESYIEWVRTRVWTETILAPDRWAGIMTLAEELRRLQSLDGVAVHALLQRVGVAEGVLGAAGTRSHGV